jgi:hypothetical protein
MPAFVRTVEAWSGERFSVSAALAFAPIHFLTSEQLCEAVYVYMTDLLTDPVATNRFLDGAPVAKCPLSVDSMPPGGVPAVAATCPRDAMQKATARGIENLVRLAMQGASSGVDGFPYRRPRPQRAAGRLAAGGLCVSRTTEGGRKYVAQKGIRATEHNLVRSALVGPNQRAAVDEGVGFRFYVTCCHLPRSTASRR